MAGIIGVVGKKTLNLSAGASIDLASARSLLLSVNATLGYELGVHVVKGDGSFVEIVGNSKITYGSEDAETVCIYVSNNRIIVKNNTPSTKQLFFNVITF